MSTCKYNTLGEESEANAIWHAYLYDTLVNPRHPDLTKRHFMDKGTY